MHGYLHPVDVGVAEVAARDRDERLRSLMATNINNNPNVADPFVITTLKFLLEQITKVIGSPREASIQAQLMTQIRALQADPTNGDAEPAAPAETF